METSVALSGSLLAATLLSLVVLGAESTRTRRESDGDEDRGQRRWRVAEALAVAVAFGFAGLVGILVWNALLISIVRGVTGTDSTLQETVVLQISNGLGTVTGAVLYLRYAERGWEYFDLRRPTRLDVGYGLAGLVVVGGTFVAVNVAMRVFGIEGAAHGTSDLLAETANPALLTGVFMTTSVLVIGPGEELLYRNVVQKSLYDGFSRGAAVVVGSVVFAAVHFSAYADGTPLQVLTSLTVVFTLSLTLGAVYERTDNVLVPAAVHGLFNAGQFALIAADRTDVIAVVLCP
jgi:membrane protease YdiL (CAAX protease family)